MIFYVVIGATVEELCNFRPLISVLHVQLEYFVVFVLAPTIFLTVRI